jgi:hypothetical protein
MAYTCIDKGIIRTGDYISRPVVTDMDGCKRICDANEKCKSVFFSNDEVVDGKYPCTMMTNEKINDSLKVPIGYDPNIYERLCIKGKVKSHPLIIENKSTPNANDNSPKIIPKIVSNVWFWISLACFLGIALCIAYIVMLKKKSC